MTRINLKRETIVSLLFFHSVSGLLSRNQLNKFVHPLNSPYGKEEIHWYLD